MTKETFAMTKETLAVTMGKPSPAGWLPVPPDTIALEQEVALRQGQGLGGVAG